ncbi:MAG: hypothetical protein ABIS18_09525 [Actinomycetota bacterium]
MTGPAAAFTLTSVQLLVGTFIFLFVTMLSYRFINRGYYRSAVWVLAPMQILLALVVPTQVELLVFASGASMALFLLAVYSQRPLLEWITGGLATGTGLWLLVVMGGANVVHALSGTFVLGSVTHAMVLGHWYLNQARLPIEPLKHATRILFAILASSLILGMATRGDLIRGSIVGSVIVFSSSTYWWTWLLLLATTAFIGVMVYATVKARSTQSATGLLYIAIVTALGAQFMLNLLVVT